MKRIAFILFMDRNKYGVWLTLYPCSLLFLIIDHNLYVLYLSFMFLNVYPETLFFKIISINQSL
jgi:hypothetical protein